MSGGDAPGLANAELVDWQIERGEGRIRIRVKEGATLELETVVMNVLRSGNDPATGFPVYSIQAQQLIRLVQCDKKLRKSALLPPGSRAGTPMAGFA